MSLGDEDVKRIIPWLRNEASQHRPLKFCLIFLLDDMTPYLAFCVGVCSANFKLWVAGIRQFAHVFTGTDKDRYRCITVRFLADLARMTVGDRDRQEAVLSASYSGQPFVCLALDKKVVIYNRTIQPSLTKVMESHTSKLAPIVEPRKDACENAELRFFEQFKARDILVTLVKGRMEFIRRV